MVKNVQSNPFELFHRRNTNPNLIEVIEASGEWFVRVAEDGKEDSRSFEIESYALAFAEGQRGPVRVGPSRARRARDSGASWEENCDRSC